MGKVSSKQRISKYISYLLRHNPESIGLVLDKNGWAHINDIIELSGPDGLTREQIETAAIPTDKKRFVIEGDRIRALHGHSIKVDLGLDPTVPPLILYHGTATRNLDAIMGKHVEGIQGEGLKPMTRDLVHMSADHTTAYKTGKRHGNPIVLTISALQMHKDGYILFQSANGVWLTNGVPRKYLATY